MTRRLGVVGVVLGLVGAYGCKESHVPPGTVPVLDVDLSAYIEDGDLPELSPPLAADAIRAIYDDFDWSETDALANQNELGDPALYYALVFLSDFGDEELLELMGVPFDALPFFEEELAQWDGQVGIQPTARIDEGTFVYAMIPAEAYNILRDEALAGVPVFDAIVIQDPPTDAALLSDGSLSYEYLSERGFEYETYLPEAEEAAQGSATLEPKRRCRRLCKKLKKLGKLFRPIRAIIKIGRGVVNGIRRLAAAFRPKRVMRIEIRAANTSDSLFNHPSDPSTGAFPDEPVQVWGAEQGRPVRLRGAKVLVRQRMALAVKKLDRHGNVEIRVPRATKYSILLRLTNPAARIVAIAAWEKRLVLHGLTGRALNGRLKVDGRKGLVNVPIHDIRSKDLNALLQVQDGHDLAETVFGIDMPRITVSNGTVLSDADQDSFAWCADTYATGILRPPAFVLNILLDLAPIGDMALRRNDSRGRGVVAHEYGHVFMCDALFRQRPGRFGSFFRRIAISTSSVDDTKTAPGRIWEALADWYTSQTLGAINKFDLASTSGLVADRSMFYCDALGTSPCLEDNVGGTSQVVADSTIGDRYEQDRARVATILTDAFDGGSNAPQNSLGNGSLWSEVTIPGTPSMRRLVPTWGADAADENVTLGTNDFYRLIDKWMGKGSRISEKKFMNALAETMRDAEYDESEICDFFALHASTGNCADLYDFEPTLQNFPVLVSLKHVPPPTRRHPPDVEITWEHFDEGGAVTEVEILSRSDDLEYLPVNKQVFEYSRSGRKVYGRLPYDRQLTFYVRGSTDETLLSEGSATLHTLPEPVGSVRVEQERTYNLPTLYWDFLQATSFRVVGMNEVGDIVDVETSRRTSFTPVLPDRGTYTLRVYSLSAVGEQTPFPSDVVTVVYEPLVGPE